MKIRSRFMTVSVWECATRLLPATWTATLDFAPMAGRIPQSFIDDLTARADIVELIGSRVELKKAGREYRACCPFHNEKTPSFWVSPVKQFYHCFGCGAHGTALGFLMEYDKLSFPEAIEELAGRLGLDVPREAGEPARHRRQHHAALRHEPARGEVLRRACCRTTRARKEYAKKRGLTRETVDKFMIGFATNSWNEVLKRFGANDADRKALADCGLIIERERTDSRTLDRHYDRFRDRLMFPIRDSRGRVLAFGGRIIDAGEPKYLNSPETMLFHKGRELYGLYEVRQSRSDAQAADGGRGLHGRRPPAPGRRELRRRHARHRDHARAPAPHLQAGERSGVLLRRRQGRTRRGLARARQRAARSARRPADPFPVPARRATTRIRWSARKAARRSRSGSKARCRCPNTWLSALGEQADLSHADGRAQFAELARPLVTKVAPGVYRDLLIDRLSESIKLTSARLNQLWFNEVTDTAGNHLAGAAPRPSPASRAPAAASAAAAPARRRRRQGAGHQGGQTRGPFPADRREDFRRPAHAARDDRRPGLALPVRAARPAPAGTGRRTPAVLLERWRDRPGGRAHARAGGRGNARRSRKPSRGARAGVGHRDAGAGTDPAPAR